MSEPVSFYYPLFEHMSREHGLTLLDSEMDEIMRVCAKINRAPKIGVVAVVHKGNGQVLLGKKKRAFSEELVGKWVIPGGRVNYGETLLHAIRREVFEETGLRIDMVGQQESAELIHGKDHFVFAVFQATQESSQQQAVAGDDLEEVRWVSPLDLANYELTPLTKEIFERMGIPCSKDKWIPPITNSPPAVDLGLGEIKQKIERLYD